MKIQILNENFLPAHMPAPKNERISSFINIAMISKIHYIIIDYQYSALSYLKYVYSTYFEWQ